MSPKLVHLIYIHGFRGNDTTFQSFPSDLQQFLSSRTPPNLNVTFKTSLYPTYKSVKPISHATRNFLEWLSTQPPDPVILMCHSMGGLLGAETLVSKRIIGMVAFDVPFLGMHPHVVISGIASLFPKDENRATEREMNPEVKVVNDKVTDDWDNFKKNLDARHSQSSFSSNLASPSPSRSPLRHPSPDPSRSQSPDNPFVERALSFINEHSNDPIVRWFRKHSDEPFTASKRWVVEHFQFGICMFDPSGLRERYSKLVAWRGGMWVNYWTQTVPKVKDEHLAHQQQITENDLALLDSGIADNLSLHSSGSSLNSLSTASTSSTISSPISSSASSSSKEDKEKHLQELQQQKKKEVKALKEKHKIKGGRHFIVLPTGLGQVLGGSDKWEKVSVGGVQDEVAAHCGLFIRSQNLDYDGFVDRVATKVFSWCEGL